MDKLDYTYIVDRALLNYLESIVMQEKPDIEALRDLIRQKRENK